MGKTNTSNTNPPEDFNDGNKFQISKISTFQKYTGTRQERWSRVQIVIIQQQE